MDTDARKLSWNSLTDLRKRALACIHEGQNPGDVALMLSIGKRTIYNWIALYRNGGWGALNARRRGGRPTLLDGKKLQWIYRTVVDGSSIQMKSPSTLWMAKTIGSIIEEKYGITLSKASICRLLEKLGITPQRPLWVAHQQKPEAVRKWLTIEFPMIREMAKKEKGEIYFAEEAGVRSVHPTGTTRTENGKTPVDRTTGERFSHNVISAVNAQGEFRFMVVEGAIGPNIFREFIKRLAGSTSRKVFLIVDGHPTHKSVAVRKLLKTLESQVRVFFLPPTS